MKKILLPLVLLISFMLLFIGCPGNGGGGGDECELETVIAVYNGEYMGYVDGDAVILTDQDDPTNPTGPKVLKVTTINSNALPVFDFTICGTFSDITSISFDYYIDSSSTTASIWRRIYDLTGDSPTGNRYSVDSDLFYNPDTGAAVNMDEWISVTATAGEFDAGLAPEGTAASVRLALGPRQGGGGAETVVFYIKNIQLNVD